MPKLVLPSIHYKDSYLAAVKEFQTEQQHNYIHLDVGQLASNFDSYVNKILAEAQGVGLPEGYVPHTVYWLVEGDEFLGRVDIRHGLNEFLRTEGGHIGYDIRPTQRRKGYGSLALKLAIAKAKELGIRDILLTCDVGNIGSNKIIQKNGGSLTDTYQLPTGVSKNRYWIKDSGDSQ